MKAIRILYVEDELNLASIVQDTLASSGYEVHLVSDGAKVMASIPDFSPDICLLDVMLPNIDGFTLGGDISHRFPELPIIFLTAKSQSKDVIKGFQSGGNDYIKKPFSMEELMVRIDNLLSLKGQRIVKPQSRTVQFGQFEFNPLKQLLTHKESERKLSYREVELLQYFTSRLNTVISKKDLMLSIWGDDNYYNGRNLDVYVKKLRGYLSADPGIAILTLRGVGYKVVIDS